MQREEEEEEVEMGGRRVRVLWASEDRRPVKRIAWVQEVEREWVGRRGGHRWWEEEERCRRLDSPFSDVW